MFFVVALFFVVVILIFRKIKKSDEEILRNLSEQNKNIDKYEFNLREEFGRNREESLKSAKDARTELSNILKSLEDKLSSTITNFTMIVDNKMHSIQDFLDKNLKSNRMELSVTLESFENKFSTKIEALTKDTKDSLEKNRETIERKLYEIQESNEKKLEKMRETVDERLQKTLEFRLGESFKLVSERLELVQKGLGAMQSLASDVGDLKKVMSNVKTKGILGEYQLESILEQILSPNQYEKNVATKMGSSDRVEFALKIPSKDDSERIIWLPIDAKLPTVDYEELLLAYDKGDKDEIEEARKTFYKTIKAFAKKINEKYIDSPNTSDFGIMFLPFEGAYAEVVRDPGLYESIQRDHKIVVTGPSTIAAFLNALQIGFRCLAVEKGTGIILSTLKTAKKEFGNFETILLRVKDQIDKASNTLDETVGKRTRAINRALKNIETSGDNNATEKLLDDMSFDFTEE